jgi:phosphohistidine phosphatase
MNLFILRHASAGERRPNPVLDSKRPLDKEGKRYCLHLGQVLGELKRSVQTASLVGTEVGYESQILMSKALSPAATFRDFQGLLAECRGYENLLVVGHNPNLSQFLAGLIVPVSAPALPRIRLRKGSLARVSLDHGPATLLWLLDPRPVRALYITSTKSSRRKTSRK